MNWEAVLSALIGGVISGGGIAYVGYEALKGRLARDFRDTFAKSSDLDGVGTRVNAFEKVLIMARDTADANSDRLTKLEEASNAGRAELSRTLGRIDATLNDMDNRQRAAQSEITRTVAMLDSLEKRMDRHAPHE